jgi:hypothetical protein
MDSADPSRREDADADCSRDSERAADRCRADGVLDGGGRKVSWPDLASFGCKVGELVFGKAHAYFSVQHPDRRRHSTRRTHLTLGLEAGLDPLARREAVRDERGLERDDGTATRERLVHLVREADHAERSISMKRLSSPRRASWKPARR